MEKIWRNVQSNKNLFNMAARSHPFILFDTETTGLRKDAQIVEIAALKCEFYSGRFHGTQAFHMYIRPDRPVPQEASDIHGLTDEFLSDKMDERRAFPYIRQFFGGSPSLGAYNSAFDVRMLSGLYGRCGEALQVPLEVDFLKIARDIFCGQKLRDHKLATVANTYGVDEGIEFHSAYDDVRVLLRVVNAMIRDISENAADPGRQKKTHVMKLDYYDGYRGNSRLYATSSAGKVYYSLKDDRWMSQQEGLDLSAVDMADFERQVFLLAGVGSYPELRKKCREGAFSAPKKEAAGCC